MSAWSSMTTEQRLEQIDGAIELGLTARQTAMNLRGHPGTVRAFANTHGRHFKGTSVGSHISAHSYWRSIRQQNCQTEVDSPYAFAIFDRSATDSLFDSHPLD